MSKIKLDDPVDFDMEFTPQVSASKLGIDITEGLQPLSDFMMIPCTKIIEYQNKKESDFKPWPEERFQMLVDSVKQNGVIDPVAVRPLSDQPGLFEMLAGEHRWKASIAAGLSAVPAHVMRNCSDKTAADIFSITNLLRRDNSVRDKVNGWWHYTQAVYYKRNNEIQQMVNEGILNKDLMEQAKKGMRQAYRYARMHNLIDELLDLADQKHLSINAAEQLSYLSEAQQLDLLPYKHNLNNSSLASSLHALADGTYPEMSWSKENIEKLIFPEKKNVTPTLKEITKEVGVIIKERFSKEKYGQAVEIINAALDVYMETHPELKK